MKVPSKASLKSQEYQSKLAKSLVFGRSTTPQERSKIVFSKTQVIVDQKLHHQAKHCLEIQARGRAAQEQTRKLIPAN